MSVKKIHQFDFEKNLKELEGIVNSIEKGGINLEKSLVLFAKGINLTKGCQTALKTAEQKVKILIEEKLTNFEPTDEEKNV